MPPHQSSSEESPLFHFAANNFAANNFQTFFLISFNRMEWNFIEHKGQNVIVEVR